MTLLRSDRPIVRETACLERGRAIVVKIYPRHVELRLKGERCSYAIDWGTVFWRAVKAKMELTARDMRLRRNG